MLKLLHYSRTTLSSLLLLPLLLHTLLVLLTDTYISLIDWTFLETWDNFSQMTLVSSDQPQLIKPRAADIRVIWTIEPRWRDLNTATAYLARSSTAPNHSHELNILVIFASPRFWCKSHVFFQCGLNVPGRRCISRSEEREGKVVCSRVFCKPCYPLHKRFRNIWS